MNAHVVLKTMTTKTKHLISSNRPDHYSARSMAALAGLSFVRFLPLLVLAVSLTITYFLWQDARQNAMRDLQAHFDSRVHEAAIHVEQRMAAYKQVLRGVKG